MLFRFMKKAGAVVLALMIVLSGFCTKTAFAVEKAPSTTKKAAFTIVIDPGHGQSQGYDTGAVGTLPDGSAVYERDVNLRIALYLQQELSQYANVEVYMTRTTRVSNCKNLETIGKYAGQKNADLLISVHNNSSTNSNSNGSLICVPNDHYDKNCYTVANGVAKNILSNLVSLGLKNNGLYYRPTENGSTYPDGSSSDYYGIIYHGKMNHTPSIIVEHAFMSNSDDLKTWLTNDSSLKKLAQADAKGIADYFGFKENAAKSGPVVVNKGVDYSSVFDFNYYINTYSDMKKYYGNDPAGALLHFLRSGMAEGRQGNSSFSVMTYKANYQDLQGYFGNDYKKYYVHYVNHGKAEGRVSTPLATGKNIFNGVDYSAIYDFNYYINKYPDMKQHYANNPTEALRHFINHGMSEGRQGCAGFDVQSYKNEYADLRSHFGNDLKKYYIHYMNHGKSEGRHGTGYTGTKPAVSTVLNGVDYGSVFDYNFYINKYSDMKKYYAGDPAGALKHFVLHGISEGRQAISTFDVKSYRNLNADLRGYWGTDYKKYVEHYINHGKREGRKATGSPDKIQNPVTVLNNVDYKAVYDFNYYVSRYADIKKNYGNDDYLALRHFAYHGIFEGRDGKASYDKNTYNKLKQEGINNNPELKNQLHEIMGTTSATKAQMVSYYKKNATYPDYYKNTDAPTIEAFVQIYIEECKAEGVKAEVAFAQAMNETGFLKFGGLVRIEDLNFAGIGATDLSEGRKIAQFKSVRLGVRAQVQHLKAYATTSPLNNKETVDPRFNLVTRGSAPYVEWLGIQENPKHVGWASTPNYGYNLVEKYMKKILSQ